MLPPLKHQFVIHVVAESGQCLAQALEAYNSLSEWMSCYRAPVAHKSS